MRKIFLPSILCVKTLAVLAVFLLIGCNKDKDPDNKTTSISSLKSSNLAGAKAAFITGSNKGSLKSSTDDYEELKFYKVGINNQTQTVTFTDDEGNTVPAIVDYVQSLSGKYAVMRVYNEENPWSKCVFIIRKSDGQLFTTPETLENNGTSYDGDPLGCFTWDGGDGKGIDYVKVKNIKSDSNGNLYYFGGGYTSGGTMHKIYEKNGNIEFATIENVGEYYNFNAAGDLLAGGGDLGSGLVGVWITADGQKLGSEWLINMGPEYPRVHAGEPFALSSAPNSFFTIDQIFDDTNPLNLVWEKSVLSQYTVQNGEIVREEVYEFAKRISHFLPVSSRDGIGLTTVVATDGLININEVCVIKSPNEVQYVPVSENSHSGNHMALMNLAVFSDRYMYSFYPYEPNRNTISRFDPQTGTDTPNYYTLPGEYSLQSVWATHDDVLTILAEKGGQSTYIEVSANGVAVIHDTYNDEKVILRSAF